MHASTFLVGIAVTAGLTNAAKAGTPSGSSVSAFKPTGTVACSPKNISALVSTFNQPFSSLYAYPYCSSVLPGKQFGETILPQQVVTTIVMSTVIFCAPFTATTTSSSKSVSKSTSKSASKSSASQAPSNAPSSLIKTTAKHTTSATQKATPPCTTPAEPTGNHRRDDPNGGYSAYSILTGLEAAKSALKETVVYPFLRPDLFMGLREPARGMLLFGPPGTGKTMLARAVATESKSTFFAISASSLTSKFMGDSEKLVRALFSLAKRLAPAIIFVDEIDSLLSARGGSSEHEASRRIKTEFLIQWSDLQRAAAGRDMSASGEGDATRVLVLAATNLPWAIDEAARRRFVRRQYIPLPEDHVREKQLRTLLAAQKHSLRDRDLQVLVQVTDGMFYFLVFGTSLFPCSTTRTDHLPRQQATPAPTSPPSPKTPPWDPCALWASNSYTWAPTRSALLICAISRLV
jgi:hypothetical protein